MRKAIRVLKTPVTLLALLAILGYGAVWGYEHVTKDVDRPVAACVIQDVGDTLTPDKVTVRVFNGGESGGLAKGTALYLRAWGFPAPSYKNADRRVEQTTIVGNSPDDPEVRLLQQFFEGSVAEGDGRADHVVDVIMGDKNTQVNKPVTKIAVDGPVCLPQRPNATQSPSATPSETPSTTPTKKQ